MGLIGIEIRLKYSYSGLLLVTIVIVGLIVAGFLYATAFWIVAGFFGILLVLFIWDAAKYGHDAIVINDKGVCVDRDLVIEWSQVDHCYVSIRTGENYSDDYYLVFVTKERERSTICLDRYIYKYVFPTKKFAKDINQLLGKEICYMTTDDKEYERKFRQSLLEQLKPLLYIAALVLLVALIVSLTR